MGLTAPLPRGPGTYLSISAASPFSSRPMAFGERMPWKSESAGTKVICKQRRDSLCAVDQGGRLLSPQELDKPLHALWEMGCNTEASLLDRRGAYLGHNTSGRTDLCAPPPSLVLHSFNKHLLSTCCVQALSQALGAAGSEREPCH